MTAGGQASQALTGLGTGGAQGSMPLMPSACQKPFFVDTPWHFWLLPWEMN